MNGISGPPTFTRPTMPSSPVQASPPSGTEPAAAPAEGGIATRASPRLDSVRWGGGRSDHDRAVQTERAPRVCGMPGVSRSMSTPVPESVSVQVPSLAVALLRAVSHDEGTTVVEAPTVDEGTTSLRADAEVAPLQTTPLYTPSGFLARGLLLSPRVAPALGTVARTPDNHMPELGVHGSGDVEHIFSSSACMRTSTPPSSSAASEATRPSSEPAEERKSLSPISRESGMSSVLDAPAFNFAQSDHCLRLHVAPARSGATPTSELAHVAFARPTLQVAPDTSVLASGLSTPRAQLPRPVTLSSQQSLGSSTALISVAPSVISEFAAPLSNSATAPTLPTSATHQPHSRAWLRYAAYSIPGRRSATLPKQNQDRFMLQLKVAGIRNAHIFGVCDGHGPNGHLAAAHISTALPSHLARELHRRSHADELRLDTVSKLAHNQPLPTALLKRLAGIFHDAIAAVEEALFASHAHMFERSGSTLVCVLLLGRHAVVANVGDSKCVLLQQTPLETVHQAGAHSVREPSGEAEHLHGSLSNGEDLAAATPASPERELSSECRSRGLPHTPPLRTVLASAAPSCTLCELGSVNTPISSYGESASSGGSGVPSETTSASPRALKKLDLPTSNSGSGSAPPLAAQGPLTTPVSGSSTQQIEHDACCLSGSETSTRLALAPTALHELRGPAAPPIVPPPVPALPAAMRVVPLTTDHKPSVPQERERILAMGGTIRRAFNPHAGIHVGSERVWAQVSPSHSPVTGGAVGSALEAVGIAMTRSIGDACVARVGVVCSPTISYHLLQPERDRALVLATDGVWDVVFGGCGLQSPRRWAVLEAALLPSVSEAVTAVCTRSKGIWEEDGRQRGSTSHDDITCLIVQLSPPC